MGMSLRDIYEQRELLRRGDEIVEAVEKAAEREAERMRLRDQFAAAALTGLVEPSDEGHYEAYRVRLCAEAYEWADAMLAAREAK